MAEVTSNVQVQPTTTVNTTVPTEPLAAALLKSSENQAAATMALAAALKPQPEPSLLGNLGKGNNGAVNLALLGLIVLLLWK